MDSASLFPVVMLAGLNSRERRRAQNSLVMTMVPGPAGQRAAFASLAVTTQVKDDLRKERRAVEDTAAGVLRAVRVAVADPARLTTAELLRDPALAAIATDALRDEILAAAAAAVAGEEGRDEVTDQAVDLIAQLVATKGREDLRGRREEVRRLPRFPQRGAAPPHRRRPGRQRPEVAGGFRGTLGRDSPVRPAPASGAPPAHGVHHRRRRRRGRPVRRGAAGGGPARPGGRRRPGVAGRLPLRGRRHRPGAGG